MVCPSCGKQSHPTITICACGARWVGNPATEVEYPVPRLFYGLLGLSVVCVIVVVQLIVTIKSVYTSDYRWEWELLLTTSYLAKLTLPAGIMAAWLGWRGLRLARRQPDQYGGLRLCRSCLVASLFVCLMDGGAVALRIPQALANLTAKRQAHTRAMMYKVNEVIFKYREQYGAFPGRLIDLQEMDPSIRPILDAWDHPLVYTPMSAEIASRGVPAPFQNYQLVSRGKDGIMGTRDDILMRDGLIILGHPQAHKEEHAGAKRQMHPGSSGAHQQ